MSVDATKVRPRRDWILVLADERQERLASGIYLPGHETGIEKVTEGTGLLIAVGPGEKLAKLGLAPGQRLVYRGFLKHANKVPSEERWLTTGNEKEYFLMSCDDVLGVLAPGVEAGIFSGRPAAPEGA
jgi:co-chaperonin GroES (HSP10)